MNELKDNQLFAVVQQFSRWAGKAKFSLITSKSTSNAFVESVNRKFRNECLNLHCFRTIEDTRYEIDLWQRHYNHERPHSSLNYLPPIDFALQAA